MADYIFDVIPAHKYNQTVSQEEFNRHPNDFFDAADISWMIVSSALVFLMVPGAGLFNSGISGRRSAVSMIWLPVYTAALIAIQWYLWGYSIAFAPSSNNFWGGTHGLTLAGVVSIPSGNVHGRRIPELLYALYQGMFASFTAALVSGAVIRKGRILPFLVFIFLWSTFIYDPIARWTWSPEGWSNKFGTLDFAGGTAVHITAASTAAVYSFFFRIRGWLVRRLAPRAHQVQPDTASNNSADQALPDAQNPHNVVNVVVGTIFLWIGWFGFNGGSALGANIRAVSACVSTFLAACAGGITWSILDYILLSLRAHVRQRKEGKFSVIGFCNGVIAGLVAITPAAGYVSCRSSLVFGIAAAICCCLANNTSLSLRLLDELDIFVIHGVGGWVGMILTGFFAKKKVPFLDGYTVINGGAIDDHWKQLGIQICDALAGMGYASIGSFAILAVMELLMYPIWGITDPEGNIVTDRDDIRALELIEIEAQHQQ